MPKLSSAVIAAAVMALAAAPAPLPAQGVPAGQQESIRAAIQALNLELRAAAQRLDAAALYRYVVDSETPPIIENGTIQRTHAAAVASTTAGFQALQRISYAYTLEHITVLSPTVALWVGEGQTTATLADGREISLPFAETLVLVRRGDGWQVLHGHRSSSAGR